MVEPLPSFVRAQALDFNAAPTPPTSMRIIGFPTSAEQAKSNWCWAAVTSAIMVCRSHPEAASSQRDIVRRVLGSELDETAQLFLSLNAFQIGYSTSAGSDLFEPGTKAAIVNHIASGLPVAIHIAWDGSSSDGHAVCAFGLDSTGQEAALWIYDPSAKDSDDDNEKLVPISQMTRFEDGVSNGTTGSWVATFRITSP
jgi:hypothetical protein